MNKIQRQYMTIMREDGDMFSVEIPAWEIFTQGKTIEGGVIMAKDAIKEMAKEYREQGKEFPEELNDYDMNDVREGKEFIMIDVEI